jgi:hypothetical protein
MVNISSITQLATTLKPVATSLTRNMGIAQNGTQPVPLAGPSVPNNTNVAAASMFASSLGGSTPNVSVLGAISEKMVGTPRVDQAGLIASATYANTNISGASAFLENSGAKFTDASSTFTDQGLADVANASFSVGSDALNLSGLGGEGALNYLQGPTETEGDIPKDWLFITAPQSISWDKQGETSIVNTYGSNNPYVIYSSTGMRKLSLGDCLVEGFSAGKEVEDHVLKLEKLMTTVMNTEKGYVSPYVWDLRAGDKSYGKFIIESLQIKEDMRNAKGRADRATVSISLQQVPDFQINDGRDLATKADLASGQSLASEGAATDTSTADAAANKAGDKVKSGDQTKTGAAAGSGAAGGTSGGPAPVSGRAAGGGSSTGP